MTLDPAALLQHAIAHHQAGRLADAEALYRTILQQAPHHPDAHHNLGQLARQVGQPRAALPHLQAAVNANPSVGQYWLSLIAALIDCGETTAARHVLDQGRARGLAGEAVETLAARLAAAESVTPPRSLLPRLRVS